MGYCMGGTQQGGRRRRTGKTKKTRMTKKAMRGGNFYGFTGGVGGTSAGAGWESVENTAAKPDGTLIANGGELSATQLGGRRRRGKGKKTRKGGRKGRKGRRTMRGGANFVSVAPAGGSYTGQGAGGLISLTPYAAKTSVDGGPVQGGDGVYRA